MWFVCLQVPLEEGLNKTIQYFSRELEHQANNQYIPKPKAARMKKGRPRHNWWIVLISGMLGYWRTLDVQQPFYSVGFPPPTNRTIFLRRRKKRNFSDVFCKCFEKQLRQIAVSKECFSVKCASKISDLQTLPCTLVCQSSVCYLKQA